MTFGQVCATIVLCAMGMVILLGCVWLCINIIKGIFSLVTKKGWE